MGNSFSLKGQELKKCPEAVYITSTDFVVKENSIINARKDVIFGKKRYIFYDKVGDIPSMMFKPLHEFNELYLCDMHNRPIVSYKKEEGKSTKIYIKTEKNYIGKIRICSDRMKVEIYNKENKQKEEIQIKTNNKLTECGIYYGILEENAPLIAKIYLKEKNLSIDREINYIYEIAENVDVALIAILGIFITDYRISIAKKYTSNDEKKKNKKGKKNKTTDSDKENSDSIASNSEEKLINNNNEEKNGESPIEKKKEIEIVTKNKNETLTEKKEEENINKSVESKENQKIMNH